MNIKLPYFILRLMGHNKVRTSLICMCSFNVLAADTNTENLDNSLKLINAPTAHSSGIDGRDINIGMLDGGYLNKHDVFSASKITPLNGAENIQTEMEPIDDEPSGPVVEKYSTHGAAVSSILVGSKNAASNYDGGVAPAAHLYQALINPLRATPSPDDQDDPDIKSDDVSIFNIKTQTFISLNIQSLTKTVPNLRVINNSWNEDPVGGDKADVNFTFQRAMRLSEDKSPLIESLREAVAKDVLLVFAAGNEKSSQPGLMAALPHYTPELENHFISAIALNRNNTFDESYSNQCGVSKYWCLAAPGTVMKAGAANNVQDGPIIYGLSIGKGTSFAAPLISGSAALLKQRFPYMNMAQIRDLMLTTASPAEEQVGVDDLYGWGRLDLGAALRGPGQLLGRFDANLAQDINDIWSNNISDVALIQRQNDEVAEQVQWQQTLLAKGWKNGLPENASDEDKVTYQVGTAREQAAQQRQYEGSLVKLGAGNLTLTGNNTYRGPTLVKAGLLTVDGSLTSGVTISDQGTLGGSGRVGSLTAIRGGTVAPGNSIGTLQVSGDVAFESGSIYAVELSATNSDRIVADGKASLAGGTVTLVMEHSPTLLNQQQIMSLNGRQYNILSAAGGITGRFESVLPDYLFLGGTLNYAPHNIQLNVGRNGTSFASVAATPNQRAVAGAIDQLGTSNPVHESILQTQSVASARQAFQQLSGEIYPAVGTLLLRDSRYVRDAVGERLRNEISDVGAGSNVWLKTLGAWGKSDGNSDNASSTHSVRGLLAGVDAQLTDDTQVGVLTGHSRSSLNLNGGTHSSASINSYHLGVYAKRDLGALQLSAGAAHSWNRGDVKRNLQYDAVSARQKAKMTGNTTQLFSEAAYRLDLQEVVLEPFANLSYVNISLDRLTETGSAAALKSRRHSRDAVASTLGARVKKTVNLTEHQKIDLSATLGGQRNLSGIPSEDNLELATGGPSFSVRSMPIARNIAMVGAQASIALTKDVNMSLSYNGQLSSNEKTHGAGLNLNWVF
ncbi:autotransporter domain-containing protein [Pseudomonas chlororaphis]|uniref:autotransporter domain-containing protein n=1 Tax=Pseudomonas chlororaphis TaxID=587753 RepID=UPI0024087ACA|nr:autotransporter serine protease [Pseudomonas chlororaphis]